MLYTILFFLYMLVATMFAYEYGRIGKDSPKTAVLVSSAWIIVLMAICIIASIYALKSKYDAFRAEGTE